MRRCSIKGCDRPYKRIGYCNTHSARIYTKGSVADPKPKLGLETHVVDPGSGCWIWTGAMFANGYGQTSTSMHGTSLAHRAMFMETNGPLPAEAVLDHLCRRKLCINPNHLDVVTGAENVRRGLSSYAMRNQCKNGLHDISKPESWYTPPGNPGIRSCLECSRAKWARQDAKRRAGRASRGA